MLDAATGVRLWELSGELYLPATPEVRQALAVARGPDAPEQASYTDLRTGRAIWTRPVPAEAQIAAVDARMPSDGAGFVVVAALDGTTTLLARDTGAVLGSMKIERLVPVDITTSNPPDIALVEVIGGRLLVTRRIGTTEGEVASYDLPGLTLRWSRGGLLAGYPWPCGPNLCLSGFTGAMTALDPATGASRWTNEDWQAPASLGGGRLLAFRDGDLEHAGILDSTTGRLLGDLGSWAVVSGPDIHLALRPVAGRFRSTWVGVVDPGRATVRPVGMLDGLSLRGCLSRADLLVCPTMDLKVRVWRYHPGR
jgi:outer membrane protein assembly factor BamB